MVGSNKHRTIHPGDNCSVGKRKSMERVFIYFFPIYCNNIVKLRN